MLVELVATAELEMAAAAAGLEMVEQAAVAVENSNLGTSRSTTHHQHNHCLQLADTGHIVCSAV